METQADKPKNKGGRPIGSTNRLAMEAREKARATGELPHEFLLRIARGEVITRKILDPATGAQIEIVEDYDFEARRDAAKAAAPYFAPKISTVEIIKGVQDDELDSIIAELAAQTGFSFGAGGEEPTREAEAGEATGQRSNQRQRVRLID